MAINHHVELYFRQIFMKSMSSDECVRTMHALLSAGLEVNRVYRLDCLWAPIHYACSHGVPANSFEAFRLLLDSGAHPNMVTLDGTSPLMFAVESAAAVSLLIERGANVNYQNSTGLTALHVAAKCGYHRTVQILLMNGADAAMKLNTGETAVDICHEQLAQPTNIRTEYELGGIVYSFTPSPKKIQKCLHMLTGGSATKAAK